MRPVVRIALVVVGLAAAVYGIASLTGGWLGTPPWWERTQPMTRDEWFDRYMPDMPWQNSIGPSRLWYLDEADRGAAEHVEPRPAREWIPGGVVAAGLAVTAFGAWPRRRREGPVT